MQLSKNVVRSMKTDIKNKLEKAVRYQTMAKTLQDEANELQKLVTENSEPELAVVPQQVTEAA